MRSASSMLIVFMAPRVHATAGRAVVEAQSTRHVSVPSGRVFCASQDAPSAGSQPIDLLALEEDTRAVDL